MSTMYSNTIISNQVLNINFATLLFRNKILIYKQPGFELVLKPFQYNFTLNWYFLCLALRMMIRFIQILFTK